MRSFSRVFAALVIVSSPLTGQDSTEIAPGSEGQPPVRVDSASPRASVLGYLNAARDGDYGSAAHWLDPIFPDVQTRGEELAKRLKGVLDAHLWINVYRLSPSAFGDTLDGLPRDSELLGELEGNLKVPASVRLTRIVDSDGTRWVFAASTLARVDEIYDALPDRWIREHLPPTLMRSGPLDLLWWQWLALPILVLLSLTVGLLAAPPTAFLFRRIAGRTRNTFDDQVVTSGKGPVILFWSVVASRVLLRWVALSPPAHAFLAHLQSALMTIAVFWLILRILGVLQGNFPATGVAKGNPALQSLIPLLGRIFRVLVFVIGVLAVIAQFGYPVGTILAGLGIGGIAVALGAQKSFEHFFGSVSIGIDQPFRLGDWVNIGGMEGSVEAIGLRSTRVRTSNRTLVTVPNGKLAESTIENFGARDRIRFRMILNLEYGLKAAQIREIRDGLEELIRANESVWPGNVHVRLTNLGESSIDFEIFCWVRTKASGEFSRVREELLIGILGYVESKGAELAYPTRKMFIQRRQ